MNELFWVCILVGNLVFVLFLNQLRKIVKKNGTADISIHVLLSILLFGIFLAINPILKVAQLPEIIAVMSSNKKIIWGLVFAMIFAIDMAIYHFLKFQIKRKTLSLYIFYDVMYLGSAGLWLVSLFGTMLFIAAAFGNYKTTWNWGMVVILIVMYIGRFILSVLEVQRFTICDNQYSYCAYKKKCNGIINEISAVKGANHSIELLLDDRKCIIKCSNKYLIEELFNKVNCE